MPNLINTHSAIPGAPASASPTVNDSASQLQGARPIPVPSVRTGHDTSPSISTSDYIPDLHGAQLRKKAPRPLFKEAAPFSGQDKTKISKSPQPQAKQTYLHHKLVEHTVPDLIASLRIDNKILHTQPEVCPLSAATPQGCLEIAEALTKNGGELPQLQQQLSKMNADQLQELLPGLLPLLRHDQAWVAHHLLFLTQMSAAQLQYLLPLLQHDQEWTTNYLPLLDEMDGRQLKHLLPLLQHDQAWTTHRLSLLREMDGRKLKHLLPFLQHDKAETNTYLPLIQAIDENLLPMLLLVLKNDLEKIFQEVTLEGYEQLLRFFNLKWMDISSEGFSSAANPYMREALFMDEQDKEELARVLKTHGASRSTFHPERKIDSYLTEKFKNNYQKIPGATFGVENEMFIPGIPESIYSEIEDELNERLGIKDKKYRYVNDETLFTEIPSATPPIEQATSILNSPEDIQRLQSVLSILNDWKAFTNHTAGVHIHTGIRQWKAADCLNTPEEKSKNPFLHQWDQARPDPEAPDEPELTMTPYQLLFMKQFLVNMVAMQENFYLVSRNSAIYSRPNGPINGNNLNKYYRNISSARSYVELLSSANMKNRYFNVNLLAYAAYGTIEVRGFTKKNSDNMEVDPNLPVRDLVFMQEVLIKVLHDTRNVLLSGASPEDPIDVRPSTGLTEIVKEYVQDVFLLEIIHALGQRNAEMRVKTMEAVIQDKDLISSETLQKIRESQADLLERDPLAQHFLTVLHRDAPWNPSSVETPPLKRVNSLRSMADAVFSEHEQRS